MSNQGHVPMHDVLPNHRCATMSPEDIIGNQGNSRRDEDGSMRVAAGNHRSTGIGPDAGIRRSPGYI